MTDRPCRPSNDHCDFVQTVVQPNYGMSQTRCGSMIRYVMIHCGWTLDGLVGIVGDRSESEHGEVGRGSGLLARAEP